MTARKRSGAERRPDGTFPPGRSGNPSGRPKGARSPASILAAQLLDGEGEALARKAVELALAGDVQALRLCLERLLPPARDALLEVDLPAIEGPDDLPKVTAALVAAVGEGRLTPAAARDVAGILEQHRRAVDAADTAQRLEAIEAILKARMKGGQ